MRLLKRVASDTEVAGDADGLFQDLHILHVSTTAAISLTVSALTPAARRSDRILAVEQWYQRTCSLRRALSTTRSFELFKARNAVPMSKLAHSG